MVNQVFLYCIARAAARAGVVIHAVAVLGNHIHIICTDPEGRLPEFTGWLSEYTAKCINASLGRWENLWSSEEPSYVKLESAEDLWDKMLYVLSNPTAAALVGSAEEWPGVVTLPKDFLKGPVEVARPAVFFRPNGPTPATVPFQVVPPAGLGDLPPDEFVRILNEELKLREADLRLQHRQAGRPILGQKAVLAQNPFSYPAGKEPRRNLNPRIAAKNKWRRIEAI